MSDGGVAPGLLLAMPQLPDPNFARAAVLMIDHSEEGSWGLVVNRPTELLVDEVLDQLELAWQRSDDQVVWQGGPVEPQRGCVLHAPLTQALDPEPLLVTEGIALSTAPEQLEALATHPPATRRFLLGYAGWGPSQLEYEMAEGSWLVAPATAQLVFETHSDQLWQAAIQSLGIDPATLVPATGIH